MTRYARYGAYAVVAVAAFVASSITLLPASVAASVLASATRGEVQLVGTSGTIWNGRGDLLFKGGSPAVVRNCRWTVQTERLLTGELAVKLNFPGPGVIGDLSVTRSLSSVGVHDAKLSLPAGLVAERVPQLRGWGVNGTLDFTSRSLALVNNSIAGAAQVLWLDASTTSLASPTALGDYRFELNGQGSGPAQLRLTTLRGALQLNGNGEVGGPAGFKFVGSARYTGADQARIGTLLSTLGNPAPDGSVPFKIAVPF